MTGVFSQTETAITIDGPAGSLEARAQGGRADGPLAGHGYAAVVCHPHPLHEGTMHNKVVTTLVRTYRDLGIDSVRFNFRGVGASEGEYDQAKGEVEDLLAVVAWMSSQRSEEHTSELQSRGHLVCRLLREKKKATE